MRFFATPRAHDPLEIARGFKIPAVRVSTNAEAREAVTTSLANPGVTVIVAELPEHRDNVILHGELNELISRLVREHLL